MRRVSGKVSSLVLERDGNKIKATYKVPSWMSDQDRDDHACWIDHEMRMDREYANGTAVKPIGMYVGNWNGPDITKTGADRYWIRGQERSSTVEKNYDRSWFHPVKLNIFCKKVVWGAFGGNEAVGSGWGASMQNIGPVVWTSHTIGLPRKPAITWEYNQANSKATVTIKTDEGKDWYERYDTMYCVTIRKVDGTEATLRKWTSTRATELSATFDLSPYAGANMAAGKYVTIKCQAYARGMAGDNPAKASAVTATRSLYWPSAAVIGKITCSSKTNTGRITVPVTPGKSFAASTQLQLQRRNGEDGSWSDVSGAEDNGDCKALYDTYADAAPQPGEYVYYRIKSTRDQYTQYSAVKRADCLYTAKPKTLCSATVGIVSVTPSSGGTEATIVMGWSDSTANDGWELSWSDAKGAWNSTEGPSRLQYDPSSGMAEHDTTSKSSKYKRTKTLLLNQGLEPGKTYYVRMRRYREASSTTYYSSYSAIFSFTTESAQDDRCGIISTDPSKDGDFCTIVVGFTEDNNNGGTEISYSTVSGAWSSSSTQPTVVNYDDENMVVNSPTKWKQQVTLKLGSSQEPLDIGTTYYIRARRYSGTEQDPGTYSPYSAIQKFTTASAADDQAYVVSVNPGTSGTTATVVVGFNENNPNTGTEITWSTDKAAWQSNVAPATMNATWSRVQWTGGAYAWKQTSYLRELTPGKTYYIKARRYLERNGNTDYGKWSPLQSFTTPKATAANDRCGIVSVTKHSDGLGANVVVGWTEDTANDGTELTWSTDNDAWTSNQQPNSLQATWSDKASKSTDWKKTQTISLHGLERGETYYIRARRYLEDGDGTTYSPYAPMASITLPVERTDVDVRCGLVSVEPGDDGTSAVVVVGWSGDHTGCEVTWSKDPDAWESSEQPQSTKFDWQDKVSKSGSWGHTSTLYLRGLEEGETYYIKARSYFDSDDGDKWSDYTEDMSVTPFSAPESVTLSAPSAVAMGDSIECYWAISGEMEQTRWVMHKEGQPKKALASGTGSLCHASIPASKYEGLDTISFYVDVSCGGGMTSSNIVSVGIADYPSCEVCCAETLTSQPITFEAYTDNDASLLLCTLRAVGVTVSYPDGDRDQLPGDVVWTRSITPVWTDAEWSETLAYEVYSDAASAAEDAYDDAMEAATFAATEDETVIDGTVYYEASGNTYVEVDPISAANPYSEGWYEESGGTYTLSSDTSASDAKAYYERVGSGTDEDPYSYVKVDPLTVVDPSSEGWYAVPDEDEALAISNAKTDMLDMAAVLAAHPSDGETMRAMYALPDSLELWDGASYVLSVQTVEPVAGLTSATAECQFYVEWEHQAVDPIATVTSDVDDRSGGITLSAPTESANDDVYDVYRTTPAGHELVAEGIPLDGSVADPYAPFGTDSLHYRICLRTVDGDFAFFDFPYQMRVGGIRFDWDGKFVELPWNVQLSESYSKDFETRSHADGKVDGYFGPAVEMSGSFSTDLIKVDDVQLRLVRELGSYPGAVFCRTSAGTAFQCNVNVSELSLGYNTMAAAVSLDVKAMALTEQFKCNGGETA